MALLAVNFSQLSKTNCVYSLDTSTDTALKADFVD